MSITTLPNILLYVPRSDRDVFYKDVYAYVRRISDRKKSDDMLGIYIGLYECQSKTDVHVQMLSGLVKDYGILGLDFIHFEMALLSYERGGLNEADFALNKLFAIIRQAFKSRNLTFFKHLGRYYSDESLTLDNINRHIHQQSCADIRNILLDDAPNGAIALGYFFDHLNVMQKLIRHAYRTQGLFAYLHYPI